MMTYSSFCISEIDFMRPSKICDLCCICVFLRACVSVCMRVSSVTDALCCISLCVCLFVFVHAAIFSQHSHDAVQSQGLCVTLAGRQLDTIACMVLSIYGIGSHLPITTAITTVGQDVYCGRVLSHTILMQSNDDLFEFLHFRNWFHEAK